MTPASDKHPRTALQAAQQLNASDFNPTDRFYAPGPQLFPGRRGQNARMVRAWEANARAWDTRRVGR